MCTVKTTSRAYAIAFNYEFVEDFAINNASDQTDSGYDNKFDKLTVTLLASYIKVVLNFSADQKRQSTRADVRMRK